MRTPKTCVCGTKPERRDHTGMGFSVKWVCPKCGAQPVLSNYIPRNAIDDWNRMVTRMTKKAARG